MDAPSLDFEAWDGTNRNTRNYAVRDLVEIGLVLPGKLRLVHRKFIHGKDRILLADAGAVSAVDALIGIDEQLGYAPGSRIVRRRRDGRGGTLHRTNKILDTGIGNYISHKEVPHSLRRFSRIALPFFQDYPGPSFGLRDSNHIKGGICFDTVRGKSQPYCNRFIMLRLQPPFMMKA